VNAELEGYLDQLLSIRQSAPGLVAGLRSAAFNWKPAPARWSLAQCFRHLNETARNSLPVLETAIIDAHAHNLKGDGPFAYPLLERLFVWGMENRPPIPREGSKGRPAHARGLYRRRHDKMAYQDRLAELITAADGLDLRRTRHKSPAIPLFTYSLGTSFAATLAHERRHLWQARQVRTAPSFPA